MVFLVGLFIAAHWWRGLLAKCVCECLESLEWNYRREAAESAAHARQGGRRFECHQVGAWQRNDQSGCRENGQYLGEGQEVHARRGFDLKGAGAVRPRQSLRGVFEVVADFEFEPKRC